MACLGLFGLSVFTSERRRKEIGVSAVIAFPIAWVSMHQWLKDFVYRALIGWSVFLVAGSSAVMIALLTIGFQAIKAAVANPAKSLRTE